jgi:hypothetical protein
MRKSERLGLILSMAEKRAVEKLADVEGGLSQAALIRRLIRKAAESKGLWQSEERRAISGDGGWHE